MTMDIKNDKSMDLNILYAVDKSLMDDEELFKEEDIEEYKKWLNNYYQLNTQYNKYYPQHPHPFYI